MGEFGILLLSLLAGGAGYLIANFWFRPILRYKTIKNQVASDLTFFQNTIGLHEEDGTIKKETLEGMQGHRRHAADLLAIFGDLPSWYRRCLKKRNEDPRNAAHFLIGLSNEMDPSEAKWRIKLIRDALGISIEGT